MADLPEGAVANVYQSMATAGPILDAGSPVVLSIAGSDWYLDYHPNFEDRGGVVDDVFIEAIYDRTTAKAICDR